MNYPSVLVAEAVGPAPPGGTFFIQMLNNNYFTIILLTFLL